MSKWKAPSLINRCKQPTGGNMSAALSMKLFISFSLLLSWQAAFAMGAKPPKIIGSFSGNYVKA
jgi:hypothetical protein